MSYRSLGFSADPFSNKALQADEEGEKLVVDREIEVKKLIRRVQESGKIPTLEGPNGVGKTVLLTLLYTGCSFNRSTMRASQCSFLAGARSS